MMKWQQRMILKYVLYYQLLSSSLIEGKVLYLLYFIFMWLQTALVGYE